MKKYLFIGGSHDGLRLDCGDHMVVTLPKKSPPMGNAFFGIWDMMPDYDHYTMRSFVAHNMRFEFYAMSGMSLTHAVEHLINGYVGLSEENCSE